MYVYVNCEVENQLREGQQEQVQPWLHWARGRRCSARGQRPSARGRRHSARGQRPSARARRHSARGQRCSARGRRPSARARRHSARGRRPSARGRWPSARARWHSGRGRRRSTRGRRRSARLQDGAALRPARGWRRGWTRLAREAVDENFVWRRASGREMKILFGARLRGTHRHPSVHKRFFLDDRL
jgi:hypothetical protein